MIKKNLKQNYPLLFILFITLILTISSRINIALALLNLFFVGLQLFFWQKNKLYSHIYINFFMMLFAIFVSLIFVGFGFGSEENAFSFLIPCFLFLLIQILVWILVGINFLRNFYNSKVRSNQ